MRPNKDLRLKILLEVERYFDEHRTEPWAMVDVFKIPGYSEGEISAEVLAMEDEGRVTTCDDASAFGGLKVWPTGLTLKGREYLNELRSDTPSNRAKRLMLTAGGATVRWSWGVFTAVLVAVAVAVVLAWLGLAS